jgi:AbrB family looped-hinge helix DNA binding protein
METKIIKVTDKGQIAIPTSIRKSMGIEKGDELILVREKDKILIEKTKRVSEKMKDDFKDILKLSEMSLRKLWDNEEDEIWNNV